MALIIVLTAVWYWTSAISAVASQRLVVQCNSSSSSSIDDSDASSNAIGGTSSPVVSKVFLAMATLTTLQLFMGCVVVYPLLSLLYLLTGKKNCYHGVVGVAEANAFASSSRTPSNWALSKRDFVLGAFHFWGCLFTNLGYTYGSASLVQAVKMLEPIETLLLTMAANYFLPHVKGPKITGRKIVAVLTIVCGTWTLLLQKKALQPNALSVLFALGSGLAMSCRNVAKKTFGTATDAATASISQYAVQVGNKEEEGLVNSLLSTDVGLHDLQRRKQEPSLSCSDSNNNSSGGDWLVKLRSGLENFARITASSCVGAVLLLACLSILQYNDADNSTGENDMLALVLKLPLWILRPSDSEGIRAAFFHVTYNIASITVLSLVSAPTHSLLNAGKRIWNVVVASFAFSVPLGPAGLAGLGLAALGGLLYVDAINIIPTMTKMPRMNSVQLQFFLSIGMSAIISMSMFMELDAKMVEEVLDPLFQSETTLGSLRASNAAP